MMESDFLWFKARFRLHQLRGGSLFQAMKSSARVGAQQCDRAAWMAMVDGFFAKNMEEYDILDNDK